MSYLHNDPVDFADELVEGFVAANGAWVARVPGGVVRATRVAAGEVAVVIGGGSGHYPAFAGLVGAGLAHGAAMGNLFASPSSEHIVSVARAAHAGAGILFSYGNYAGDVLNFDEAQERLIAEGIACRTVVVTDDVSSAGIDERHRRRGIAGGLAVFKAAAAAAEAGGSLDEVWELAHRANDSVRTLGVAFTGCTLPGASEPLFTVPAGRMAVGMGIHGEPGVDEVDIPSADGLADLLVRTLLDELPETVATTRGAKAAVILNGLGAVKYEELFVLYRRVAQLLDDAGVIVVEPDVGELVTSFQMAGASLTLFWLDDELEAAWRAPADSPAYRKGTIAPREGRDPAELGAAADVAIAPATTESQAAARDVVAALAAARAAIDSAAGELGRLDAIAGDGDHGIGMQRGAAAASTAAAQAASAGAGAGTTLRVAGDAWSLRAGGTSGALWGVILRTLGDELGDELVPDAARIVTAVAASEAAVARQGKASRGDKTMLDALGPFADALEAEVRAGRSLGEAWRIAARVADAAAASTADLVPRVGRARPLAERSVGSPDPGAVSMALVIAAVENVLVVEAAGS